MACSLLLQKKQVRCNPCTTGGQYTSEELDLLSFWCSFHITIKIIGLEQNSLTGWLSRATKWQMLGIKNKQTMPGHCCQSRILHLLSLPLVQSADSLGAMFFCSQDRLLIWHENLVWFINFLRLHITSQDVTSIAAATCFACCFPASFACCRSQPVLWTSTLCPVPWLQIHLQHRFSSWLLGFPWLSAFATMPSPLLFIQSQPPEKPLRPYSLILSRLDRAASRVGIYLQWFQAVHSAWTVPSICSVNRMAIAYQL